MTPHELHLAMIIVMLWLFLPMVLASEGGRGVVFHNRDPPSFKLLHSSDPSATTNAVFSPKYVRSRRRRGKQNKSADKQRNVYHGEKPPTPPQEKKHKQQQELDDRPTKYVQHLDRLSTDGDRIIRGSRAAVDQFPYFAHLLTRGSSGEISYGKVCGGVLIAPRWVMTASHCLRKEKSNETDVSVWGFDVGFYCRHTTTNCGQFSVWIQLKDVFGSPEYDWRQPYLNDIALVELQEPVHNVPYARPDDGRWYSSAVPYQTRWTAVGRGYSNLRFDISDYLEYAEMTLIDTAECETAWWGREGVVDLDGRVFCMAVQSGVTPCDGDSGGPVVWRDTTTGDVVRDEDGRVVITGLVFGGDGERTECLEANRLPAFFLQVSSVFSVLHQPGLVCSGVAQPTWCAPSEQRAPSPAASPAPSPAPSSKIKMHDAVNNNDDDDDEDDDDDACEGVVDDRFGKFRPNMRRSKAKTCKWLGRKPERKQKKLCGNSRKSNAADVCRRTCCEAFHDD